MQLKVPTNISFTDNRDEKEENTPRVGDGVKKMYHSQLKTFKVESTIDIPDYENKMNVEKLDAWLA